MLHKACALCGQPPVAAVNLGPLLGPIREVRDRGTNELWVHRLCALWSGEVWETEDGKLRKVLAAIKRGRLMKCSHCGHRGATLGCRVPSCSCSYHVACAKDAGCTYYCEQYQVACPAHAAQYRAEAKQQSRRNPFMPYRAAAAADEAGEPLAAGQLGHTPGGAELDGEVDDLLSPPTELPPAFFKGRKRGRAAAAAAHIQNAKAVMKRARRELERRRRREAEPESSDDDEHFQKKESRRLARDTAKLNPISLMGDGNAVQHLYIKSPAPARKNSGAPQLLPAQQQPAVRTTVVSSIAGTDFSSVAGLDDVVRQLREMVLLPMQYPALFEGMGLRPPRGILFHGVPGTGKTLVARALAGACAKHSPVPVTFFARKGADCLGKFHGEAERTLRLLFEEASRRAPAIIFLDELDALVPCRSARAGGGDQIYASVVSTLLSLMDGVTDRGTVIVIGATNRPEAIDPALRRPGRFDREVYFGLPTPAQRLAILRVHTKRWAQPPPDALLQQVAARAEGFAGADLQAMCTAAVMAAVRRSSPLLLEQAEREAAAAGAGMPAAGGAAGPAIGQLEAGAAATPTMQEAGCAQASPADEEQQRRRQEVLDAIEVQACDWREALASAPPPCSRRHGLAALFAEAAAPLHAHEFPLLAQPLQQVLAALDAADLPLPPPAAEAASVAAEGAIGLIEASFGKRPPADDKQATHLAPVLLRYGALLPKAGSAAAGGASMAAAAVAAQAGSQPANADVERQLERLGRSYPPCRLLLWGEGEQGQEAAAGALLKLMDGCPVHCLSLPSLVAEGGDDTAAGCVGLVSEALRRAGPSQPCVFYLPRLESWALSKARMNRDELAAGGWYCQPRYVSGGTGGAKQSSSSSEEEQGDEPWSVLRSATAGLQSPRFGGTSPLGSSPGHRGFLVAPSPFSGLLPLEERVGHTPAVARALRSVTQRHRAERYSLGGDSSAPSDKDALTMQQSVQQRGASADPGSPARPPRPPTATALLPPPTGLARIRTSLSPQQQPLQPQLAIPRAEADAGQGARGSRAQRTGLQPAAAAAPAPVAAVSGTISSAARGSQATRTGARPAAAACQAAAPASSEAAAAAAGGLLRFEQDEGQEGQEEADVEVVCLSQAWHVFESLMRQVPATQPVIVLATCHAPADGTPANLVQFFAGPAVGPVAGAAAGQQQQQHAEQPAQEQQQGESQQPAQRQQPTQGQLGQPLREAGALPAAGAVAAPSIVRMQQPGSDAWQQAAAAAAEQVAAAVATQAALLLHQGFIAAAAGVEGGALGSGNDSGQEQQQPQEQEQQQQSPRPAPAAAAAAASDASRDASEAPLQCNAAELEQGLRLFDQLLSFQRWMGAALEADKVAGLDRWVARFSRRRIAAAGVPSFAQIAQRCQLGGYDSPDSLQTDGVAAAEQALAAVEEQEQQLEREARRRQPPRSPGAAADRQQLQAVATAACSVQDKVESACFAVRQSLGLSDPFNQQVLAAAAAHVRRLQRQKEAEAALQAQREQQQQAVAEAAAQGVAQQQEGQQAAAAAGEAVAGEAVQEADERADMQMVEKSAGGAEDAQLLETVPLGQQSMQQADLAHAGPPAQQQQQRQEHSLLLVAREAAEEALTPPPLQAAWQQQQQQQQAASPPAAAVPSGQPAEQRAAHAAQLLQQQLRRQLVPVVQARLPAAPAPGASAWRALQEAAGRLGADAVAACGRVLGAAAADMALAPVVPGCELEQSVAQLAAQCLAAVAQPHSSS